MVPALATSIWIRRVSTALALPAALMAAPSGAVRDLAAQPAQGARTIVWAVDATGASHVDDKALLEAVATKPTECRNPLYKPACLVSGSPSVVRHRYLDPIELRRDVLRIRLFYWRRGYRDVRVIPRTPPMRDGVRVVFDITENAPTTVETIEVVQQDSILPRRLIDETVRLRPGDPLNLVSLDSSISSLRNAMWERGFAEARVDLDTSGVSNARNAGPVRLLLEPGARTIVRSIGISGTEHISEVTTRRLLRFRDGGLYRRTDMLESQRDLYISGLFSEVEISALASRDSAKSIAVRVTESKLRRLELTSGFTTADFVQLQADFTRYNFLGGARRLTLRGTLSNILAPQLNGQGIFQDITTGLDPSLQDDMLRPTYLASIEFTQPWFLSPRNQLGVSLFSHRTVVPSVVIDQGYGSTIALTRKLNARTKATLGYAVEVADVLASDVYFCVSIGVCESAEIEAISQGQHLAPVSLVTQFDATNDLFVPTKGVRARLDLEHASRSTGSDFWYDRVALTMSAYRTVSKHGVLAARIKLGWVKALEGTNEALGLGDDAAELVLHPRKQFFSGGSQSVRGYAENQLGPRILTIDPAYLTDTTLADPCTTDQLENGSCDPNLAGVSSNAFAPQPLGGTALAEASIEYRFPILAALGLSGTVFVDGAVVGTNRFADLLGATAMITPGFGILFKTPVGPVRLDLGIRPTVIEDLPVITQVPAPNGQYKLVTLNTPRRYDQAEATGGAFSQFLSRLTLHLAIGPAF